jgi:hypothetical protein
MKARLQGILEGLNVAASEPTFGGYIFPQIEPFEIKNALVRPVLNNGRDWNHPGKRMPCLATVYPKDNFSKGVPLPDRVEQEKLLRGDDMTAIQTYGSLPFYPEDERVKALAERNQEKEYALREEHHPPEEKEPLGFVEEVTKNLQMRSKYSPEQLDQLVALGFTEEAIAKAVEEEVQKDIRTALDNPGFFTKEVDTAVMLERVYEAWTTKRKAVQTNLGGATLGSDVQNPNVYRAAGTLGENRPVQAKTGAMRMMQEQHRGEAFDDFYEPFTVKGFSERSIPKDTKKSASSEAFLKATKERFPAGAKVRLQERAGSNAALSGYGGPAAVGGGAAAAVDYQMTRMPKMPPTAAAKRGPGRPPGIHTLISPPGKIQQQEGREMAKAIALGERIADELVQEEQLAKKVMKQRKQRQRAK